MEIVNNEEVDEVAQRTIDQNITNIKIPTNIYKTIIKQHIIKAWVTIWD